MASAMSGCDRVFHLAAIYALWIQDPTRIWDVNVRGTQVVCQAALDAGVERMVYTSSIAAIGILPGAAIYTSVGAGLGSLLETGQRPDLGVIFEPRLLLPILGLAALSLVPVILRLRRSLQ